MRFSSFFFLLCMHTDWVTISRAYQDQTKTYSHIYVFIECAEKAHCVHDDECYNKVTFYFLQYIVHIQAVNMSERCTLACGMNRECAVGKAWGNKSFAFGGMNFLPQLKVDCMYGPARVYRVWLWSTLFSLERPGWNANHYYVMTIT